jgi:mono/diheme cytochrome c family protein
MQSRVPIPPHQAPWPDRPSPIGSTGRSARGLAVLLVLGLASAAHARLSGEQLDRLPPAASRPVDFARDIQPILEASCAKCHGRGKSKGGFQLDTRETFLKPADSGPAAAPGDSRNSLLIHLVSGLDPDNVMPDKGTRLTAEQVGLLRAWIDQQLPWPVGTTFAREPHRNLQPRQPTLPAPSADLTHPIDRLLAAYSARHQVQPPEPVDDRRFARRVYLDVVGLLPTPDELDTFLRDPAPDRRERLVRRLLADRSRYAQHWLTFWNDLLRNDYRGTGYIDGGREQITKWLYAALRDNVPYDRFVRELVNPGDGPARGFTKGIVWRGVVNSSQTPQMQAAQNIAQVFLGVNLKCASCHDSFIDDWQLADAYGMAGIYSDEKLELVQCDKPLGRHAPVKFVFPELGALDDNAPKPQRIARLAELLTAPANGRLPRTLVNRLWARLLGRGLVEPLDVMQNPAWDPDLLDWLAEDFVAHGYDLQHTLERILTSRAYRYPAVDLPDSPQPDFVFRGPAIRRLGAEQFRDALGQLTGVWADKPEGGLDSLLIEPGQNRELPAAVAWIWSDPHAAQGVPPQTVRFRKTIDLPEPAAEAFAVVNVDNAHRLWINGREARGKNDIPWSETSVLDLRPFLRLGANTFALEAVNGGDGPNPAGLLFYARLRTAGGKNFDFASDASWLATTNRIDGWQKPEIDPGAGSAGWAAAHILGPVDLAPWNLGAQFLATAAGRPAYGTVRAALVAADPLALALGRPNREQVTSARPTTATTLQVLELTNGGTLARLLRTGAAQLASEPATGPAVVERIFRQGLGRAPTPREAELALELVGAQPRPEGVEDLLWSVAMLPEFQLVL